jgi:hypothetical protein
LQLYAEFPLFLTASESPSRDKNRGEQVPGLWVNGDGYLRPETSSDPNAIMRWSLRKSFDIRQWRPQYPHEIINDGDEVYLFCHSMMLGLFREPERPPFVASPVCVSSSSPNDVRAFSPAPSQAGFWVWAHAFDEGRAQGDTATLAYNASRCATIAVAREAQKSNLAGPAFGQATWARAVDLPDATSHAEMINTAVAMPMLGMTESDMLNRMFNGGYELARFKVRYV